MASREIIKTYRQLNKMGFSKSESIDIYCENVNCIERIFGIYTHLSNALDKIDYKKVDKKDLIKKIANETSTSRTKSELECKAYFPSASISDF